MKMLPAFFIFFLLISCQEKAPPKIVSTPKIVIVEKNKVFQIPDSRINKEKDSIVISFYKSNSNKTFWLENSSKKKLLFVLNSVSQEALFENDFDLIEIQNSEKNIETLLDSLLIEYDILLTKNLNRYIQKASKGTVNLNKTYSNWDLKDNKINIEELLQNFQKKDSFNFALKKIPPNHIVYKKLKSALEIINSYPDYTFNKTEIDHKIVLNDTNTAIIEIKKKLIYWKDLKALDSFTAIYDENTELAIKKFQMRHGLSTDGVIGIGTLQALNYSKEDRKKQIILNMERWRWFPRQFEPNYLIVNIPDYTMHVIHNNDTINSYKIIIGKAARKTPILSSKLSYLVFNPTWTIPPTILRNDIIPAIKRDTSYLSNKKITVYDVNNKEVSRRDWNATKAQKYRYVQSPGINNSLGLVKFIFPNRFSVYIHDTNSRGYFDKDIRALSSGCIRVQFPFQLAEYLLDDSEKWPLQKINDTIKTGETIQVSFDKETYIHILYWTAWSENGILQFRDDLYNCDPKLYHQLIN